MSPTKKVIVYRTMKNHSKSCGKMCFSSSAWYSDSSQQYSFHHSVVLLSSSVLLAPRVVLKRLAAICAVALTCGVGAVVERMSRLRRLVMMLEVLVAVPLSYTVGVCKRKKERLKTDNNACQSFFSSSETHMDHDIESEAGMGKNGQSVSRFYRMHPSLYSYALRSFSVLLVAPPCEYSSRNAVSRVILLYNICGGAGGVRVCQREKV